MKLLTFFSAALLFVNVMAQTGGAATVPYINVPAIPGPGAPQGYPKALPVQSLTISAKGYYFQTTRQVDSITPTFVNDANSATLLSNVSALLFKLPNEAHSPYLTLNFANTLISSVAISSGGTTPTETTRFSYGQTMAVYLQISGRPGLDTAPGYSDLYRLDAATFDAVGLTIDRPVDGASPALQSAVVSGTNLGTGRLLFYAVPTGMPDPVDPPLAGLQFSNLTATTYQISTTDNPISEQVSFAYSGFDAVPEPALFGPLLSAAAIVLLRRRGLSPVKNFSRAGRAPISH